MTTDGPDTGGNAAPSDGSPGAGSPRDSSPSNSSPSSSSPSVGSLGGGAPGDGSPGSSSPGVGSLGGGAPGDGSPGSSSPSSSSPSSSSPGVGSPGGGAGDASREADRDASRREELATAVAGLAESDLDKRSRAKLLGRMLDGLRERGVKQLFAPRKALGWITDAVSDLAPHVPVRSIDTLRAHFPGLEGDALAERLVRNAARATAGVGAVGGGIAAVEWVAPPTLLTTPVLLATETVAVVAIELKLLGELHEVYGHPILGTPSQRAVSLMQAWAARRGINPVVPGSGVATVLGTATRKQLRDMILRRFGRNLTTLAPLLTGAAIASYLNRRATRQLGDDVSRDLRLRYGKRPELPAAE